MTKPEPIWSIVFKCDRCPEVHSYNGPVDDVFKAARRLTEEGVKEIRLIDDVLRIERQLDAAEPSAFFIQDFRDFKR